MTDPAWRIQIAQIKLPDTKVYAVHPNMTIEDLVDTSLAEAIEALIKTVQQQMIDEIYKLSPAKQFKDWKPQDALVFYERLKAFEATLTPKEAKDE